MWNSYKETKTFYSMASYENDWTCGKLTLLPQIIDYTNKYVLFQLFSIFSLASIILNIAAYHDVIVNQEFPKYALLGIVVMFVTFAGLNAFGYYLWDIVRSAYKKVNEENKTSFRSNLMAKTANQKTTSPSYQIVSEYETKLLNQSSTQHWIEKS